MVVAGGAVFALLGERIPDFRSSCHCRRGISFHHIAPAPAHKILAQACLCLLLRLDDSTSKTLVERFPLAEYAIQHWVDHAQFDNVSLRVKDGIETLFDPEKPHFSRWILIHGP
jgi:hypothetical protein